MRVGPSLDRGGTACFAGHHHGDLLWLICHGRFGHQAHRHFSDQPTHNIRPMIPPLLMFITYNSFSNTYMRVIKANLQGKTSLHPPLLILVRSARMRELPNTSQSKRRKIKQLPGMKTHIHPTVTEKKRYITVTRNDQR